MICERCKIREATISYTEIINGADESDYAMGKPEIRELLLLWKKRVDTIS